MADVSKLHDLRETSRNAAVGFLLWLASRLAPRHMRPMCLNYWRAMGGIVKQAGMGRTYGVATFCWSLTQDGLAKAEAMEAEAIRAATKQRAIFALEEEDIGNA